jgi:outer membrane protein TolC
MIYNQSAGLLIQLKLQMEGLTGIPISKILVVQPTANENILHPVYPNWFADSITNPLIQYYQKQKEILDASRQLIRKEYLPKIILAGSAWARGSSIQYNDQYKSLSTGLGYQRFNYALGIGISYPLLNGLFRKDKLNINRFQLQASEYQLQNQQLALKIGMSQANSAIEISDTNLLEFPSQLKAAHDIYQQKMAQYKAGIISLIDLTNASFVLYRSQPDYLDIVTDWYLAQLGKAAFAGSLDQFIQTIK